MSWTQCSWNFCFRGYQMPTFHLNDFKNILGFFFPYHFSGITTFLCLFTKKRTMIISRQRWQEIFLAQWFSGSYSKIMIQGVPINKGIQWRHLYHLRSMRHFYMNRFKAVFQLRHLISKTPGLEIFKMWSNIFVFSKLTEILKNLYTNFNLFYKSNCLNI